MTTEATYTRFLELTGDPLAASNLVLAEALQQKKPVAQDRALTIKEAAEYSGIPVSTLYKLVEGGQLAHSRIGQGRGRIRIKPAALANLGEQQAVELRYL